MNYYKVALLKKNSENLFQKCTREQMNKFILQKFSQSKVQSTVSETAIHWYFEYWLF